MSHRVRRLLFDECIGRPVMVRLYDAVMQEVELHHITEKYATGDKDEDWIPKLGSEGGWVVITADAGRNSKVGQKLPDLCFAYRVTHVILKGQFHHKTTVEKVELIAEAWPRLVNVFSSPQGSRYFLRLRTRRGERSPTPSLELCRVTAELLSFDTPESSQDGDA